MDTNYSALLAEIQKKAETEHTIRLKLKQEQDIHEKTRMAVKEAKLEVRALTTEKMELLTQLTAARTAADRQADTIKHKDSELADLRSHLQQYEGAMKSLRAKGEVDSQNFFTAVERMTTEMKEREQFFLQWRAMLNMPSWPGEHMVPFPDAILKPLPTDTLTFMPMEDGGGDGGAVPVAEEPEDREKNKEGAGAGAGVETAA